LLERPFEVLAASSFIFDVTIVETVDERSMEDEFVVVKF
jgi:hypothetical protein